MILKSLAALIFPPRCVGCDEWGELLCSSCHSKLHFLKTPAFLPRLPKKYFVGAYSVLAYENLAHDWIHQYKYHRKFYLTPAFVSFLSQADVTWKGYDALVPVPLHWTRQMKRGFNPAHLLAHELGKKIQKRVWPCLKKVTRTKPQTKLSGEERLKNVNGSFACLGKQNNLKNTSLLLIDDVLTTGATVNECAKVLKKAGAKKVDVLTLARPL